MRTTLRVLHVEDEERDVALITRHMSRAGYEIVSDRVDTPAAMKEALETREWDLILCDYSMPHFSALQALTLMKTVKQDIPFIIISGTIGEAAAVEAMRAGVHDYLMKDSLARLVPAIEREMSEAGNRRARLKAEERLRLQSAAVQAAANAIIITDRAGNILWVNPAFTQATGYSFEEVRGKTPGLLKSGKHDGAFYQNMWETILAGNVWHDTIINRQKDGALRHEDLTITPIPDSSGALTHFVGIKQDISERMQAEAALRESEEQFRALADHSIQGIVLFQDGRTTFVNPAYCEITGLSLEESLSQTMKRRFELVHPDDRARVMDRQRRFESGERIDEVDELRIMRKDGSVRWVLASNKSITLQGMPARLGIIVDITERKQAEENLQAANQHLQRTLVELETKRDELTAMTQQLWQASKLATMGELAASIAHELNNPLATVGLRTENLMMQLPEDSEQRKPLEIIAQEVDRMASLVNNLLQFSRRSHRQVSTVDAREEIANSVEFVHYHLRTRKIKVVQEFGDPLPTIQADRQQLRQLFLNLLTNASDAMPRGGKVTVRVASSGSDDEVVAIDFSDTGEGISAEDLEKIWQPFFTTKPEGKGTGLGLAICRRIVEEHGGTIEIQSQPGEGTTVHTVFPATSNGATV
jgi:nitrogen fixation negative regulator NifL